MLFMQASPAEVSGQFIRHYPGRNPVIPGRVISPGSLSEALQAFEDFRALAKSTGKPAFVRAFWQPAIALGGKRAPAGLRKAEAAGTLRGYVNV